jgi:hypothetical protein
MKLKQFLKYLSVVAAGVTVPVLTLADNVQSGLNSISGVFPRSGPLAGAQTPQQLIVAVIQLMLIFAGIVAVLFVIIGGYFYVTSGGNAEQAEKGRNTMVNAIIGIIVVILSYVIINVIVNLVGSGQL